MDQSKLLEYEGKFVLASFLYDQQRGVVYDGLFYGIDYLLKKNFKIELTIRTPGDLLSVSEINPISNLEERIIEAIKNRQKHVLLDLDISPSGIVKADLLKK